MAHRRNAFVYFMAIAAIIISGFRMSSKKWLTWASMVVVPIFFDLMLSAK